jgi:hypothetical protein
MIAEGWVEQLVAAGAFVLAHPANQLSWTGRTQTLLEW